MPRYGEKQDSFLNSSSTSCNGARNMVTPIWDSTDIQKRSTTDSQRPWGLIPETMKTFTRHRRGKVPNALGKTGQSLGLISPILGNRLQDISSTRKVTLLITTSWWQPPFSTFWSRNSALPSRFRVYRNWAESFRILKDWRAKEQDLALSIW